MEKVDRLGWAAGLSFVSYGVRVGVRVSEAEVLGRVTERLPPGWRQSRAAVVERLFSVLAGGEGGRAGVRRLSLLYGDFTRLARAREFEEVLDAFESAVQLFVAETARRRVFVHAGAVGWRGRAMVLPGASRSGKTTLVAELVRAGADYYSDEYAVLDAKGLVHPYARPLALRSEDGAARARQTAEALGGRAGARPLPVGLVALARYEEGARWRPRRLTQGRGALALLANTVSARRDPARALAFIERAVGGARVLEGRRGDAAETAARLLEILEAQ